MDFLSPNVMHDLIEAYGLWILFGVIMMECMGIPLPGETALVTAAIYAGSRHGISIVSVVLVAAGAAIIGDNIGYLIGRTLGLRLLVRYGGYIHLDEQRLKVGQYLFLRHGGMIVFLGRFVAVLRTYSALLAGANCMRWPRFLIMNALGGICWACVFGLGPYWFGAQATRLAGSVGLSLLAIAIVLVIAGIMFFRHHERELIRRAEAALPGPIAESFGS
jgi:membrane protein DedA with SNARE-associated domain